MAEVSDRPADDEAAVEAARHTRTEATLARRGTVSGMEDHAWQHQELIAAIEANNWARARERARMALAAARTRERLLSICSYLLDVAHEHERALDLLLSFYERLTTLERGVMVQAFVEAPGRERRQDLARAIGEVENHAGLREAWTLLATRDQVDMLQLAVPGFVYSIGGATPADPIDPVKDINSR